MSRWYAFDLDGTLALDEGVYDRVGPPVPGILALVKQLLADGEEVRIVTARLAPSWGQQEFQTQIIQDWTEQHLGVRLQVQCHKDGGMVVLYDDRAIGIQHNTGIPLHQVHLLVDRAVAAQRIERVFFEKTSIKIEPKLAEALAAAVLK